MASTVIKITEEYQDKRIDLFLSSQLNLSRNQIQKLIKQGEIKVNEKKCKSSQVLELNDSVKINIPKPKISKHPKVDLELDIIHEDKNVIVINKPAGLSVHPRSPEDKTTTLVNGILAHCGNSLSGIGGELRPGIVHRLDKQTSGVIIIAKNDSTHQMLSKQFQERRTTKIYTALVIGNFEQKSGLIDSPIYRDPVDRKKMAISNNSRARTSQTEFKVIKSYSDKLNSYSLLNINLLTGRTHQIRVHMQAINHQLVGDDLYGIKKVNQHFESAYGLKRQFLHASKLTIEIPNQGKQTFQAELPAELKNCLEKINQ